MSFSYIIGQSSKFLWYSAHYVISFKYATPIKIDKKNPPSFYGKMPSSKKLLYEILNLFNEERKYIKQGVYKVPKPVLGDLLNTIKGSYNFFRDLPKIDKRRTEKKFNDVNKDKTLPKYFLRNFHYQTDGYLSEKSAELYEFQVETLFSGCAATMRRFSMIPIKDLTIKNNKLKVLDIGTGAGDFIKILKYNFPNFNITCSDLSKDYLNVAKKKLSKFQNLEFVNCKGEELPFKSNSYDLITSTYVFHEVPREIRKQIFSEISRVLRKDGKFVLTDSLQLNDNIKLNPLLEFFPFSTHEPYYPGYIKENLIDVAKEYSLECYYKKNAYLTKTLAFKKI